MKEITLHFGRYISFEGQNTKQFIDDSMFMLFVKDNVITKFTNFAIIPNVGCNNGEVLPATIINIVTSLVREEYGPILKDLCKAYNELFPGNKIKVSVKDVDTYWVL